MNAKKLKEKSIAVFICTPAVICEKWDNTNEQDGDLNKYSNIIRSIAKKNNLTLKSRLFIRKVDFPRGMQKAERKPKKDPDLGPIEKI